MVDAVVPVIEEIVRDQRPDPHAPVARLKRKQRKLLIDKHIDANAQRQHEDAGNLAEDSSSEGPDRVVEAVDVAPQRQPEPELRRHQGDENRYGVDDDVQNSSPKRLAGYMAGGQSAQMAKPPPLPTICGLPRGFASRNDGSG